MTQRSVGSVNLSFGLVHIPIKLYLSASSNTISFRQITKNGNLVKQKLVDAVTDEPVDRDDLMKGYEYSKNEFITFTKEEVDALSSEKCNTANIEEFVPLSDIDPIAIEKTLYIAPDKGADKAYVCLVQALVKTGKAAVAKWYSRGREHLVTIAPRDNGLVMHQMFYPNEMRACEFKLRQVTISNEELELATTMIEQHAVDAYGNVDNSESKSELYRDNFIDRVNDAVQSKLKGGTVHIEKPSAATNNGDLVDMLKASLKTSPAKKPKSKRAVKKTKRKAS